MKKVTLSNDLEYTVLHAIARGAVPPDVVSSDELSKAGRIVYKAVESLLAAGNKPPITSNSIGVFSVDVLGAPRDPIRQYLQAMDTASAGVEAKDILQKVRDKQTLVDVINEAGAMLQKGVLDAGLLTTRLTSDTASRGEVTPISKRLGDKFPDPPAGIGIDSLKLITRATGGLYGMWVISGEPGAGKTALAWQVALDVGQKIPAIYYDHENGFEVLMDRTKQLTNGDLNKAKHLLRMVYHRDSIRSLDSDLGVVAPPAVLVIDPVQKLPGSMEFKRASLDRWVHKLEHLKKRGYHVIMISEVPRSQYGQDAYIGAFKESGEIEYSADTAIQLLPGRENGAVEVHIVKNRHRPFKGYAAMLSRVNAWRFKELGADDGVPV